MSSGGITAVAVSGGQDSLYCLLKVSREGRGVLALHGIFCGGPEADEKAEAIGVLCRKLGASFAVVDLRGQFEKLVMEPFRRDYLAGLTPNPCSWCNRLIKFGVLKDAAKALGADYFATGHYAGLARSPYGSGASCLLAPALDAAKDQAYFLALVPCQEFENVLFPLSGERKAEIRERLKAFGIMAVEKKESRDICFIANGNRRDFFDASEIGKSGPIILRDPDSGGERQIGLHNGLENYTPGQRRGLGIPWRQPLYVVELRLKTNSLLVAERKFAVSTHLDVCQLNFFVPFSLWPEKIRLRVRYRGNLDEVSVENREWGMRCFFAKPLPPAAPGQIAVFYDSSGLILGAGVAMR